MKKWAHELYREFLKEEVQMSSKYKKALNLPSFKRHSDQNYTKISSHPSYDGHIKKKMMAIFKGKDNNKF
jgi:hypothetical protein